MAVRILSLMMVIAATAHSGALAIAAICAGPSLKPVLQELDARGIAYKRTILMAVASSPEKPDTKPA